MKLNIVRRALLLATLCAGLIGGPAFAQVKEVRISKGYGILYLPLIVMQHEHLFEKHAQQAGLGNVQVKWVMLDGGSSINDAMMAGTLDFAGIGAPGFIALWSKAKGIPNVEVVGVSGLSATSLWLNTNNPAVKSLRDFTPKDKIAVPGIKTSLSAVVLQMAAAKTFGPAEFAKLDPTTVSLPHPEALTALVGGKTEITGHFTSPPFSYLELEHKNVHRVMNSVDVLGNITLDVVFAPKKFIDANPKMADVFLGALDEANALIASDKQRAADIYVASSKVKVSRDDVLTILSDPDTHFSATPNKVMDFANFMYTARTIKVKPRDWQELFIPQLRSRQGS